jgi:hypothetical protein
MPDFTGSLTEISLAEVQVRATVKDQTIKVELPKKYFRAKNLKITLQQSSTTTFMSYRNGILYFQAKQKDVGFYTEMVTIAVKGDAASTQVIPLRIRVLPPA